MPSVTSSVTDLIGSILSAITSVLTGILGLFQNLFAAVFGVIQTLFSAVGTTISGLTQTFEGLLKFLLSNILVIGVVVAAVFLYTTYVQKGGKPIAAKKTN